MTDDCEIAQQIEDLDAKCAYLEDEIHHLKRKNKYLTLSELLEMLEQTILREILPNRSLIKRGGLYSLVKLKKHPRVAQYYREFLDKYEITNEDICMMYYLKNKVDRRKLHCRFTPRLTIDFEDFEDLIEEDDDTDRDIESKRRIIQLVEKYIPALQDAD
jgi:hypothetical protein